MSGVWPKRPAVSTSPRWTRKNSSRRSRRRSAAHYVTLGQGLNTPSRGNKTCAKSGVLGYGPAMRGLPQTVRFGALALIALLAGPAMAVAADETPTPCTEDAMIVFDASGSMAGSLAEGIGAKVRRIDEVRKALAQALPRVMHYRRIGLITYGPGSYKQCNVELNLRPMPNAAQRILHDVSTWNPSGKTPLTAGVEQAAEVLATDRPRCGRAADRRRGNLRRRAVRSRQAA